MSEQAFITTGYPFVPGESITAPKLNTQMSAGYVTVFDGNPTGVMQQYLGLSASTAHRPIGWVFANGGHIGNGASAPDPGGYAHATETLALFTLLWEASLADDSLVLLEQGGGNVTIENRNGTALLDFDANRKIATPDMSGRMALGIKNMGGISSGTSPISKRTDEDKMFEKMGDQTGTILISLDHGDLPDHTHQFIAPTNGSDFYQSITNPTNTDDGVTQHNQDGVSTTFADLETKRGGGEQTDSLADGVTSNHPIVNSGGNSGADQGVMQPSITTSYIIKL